MVVVVVVIALIRGQARTLPGTLSGRCHYYTHFTDEGTEGQIITYQTGAAELGFICP